MNELKAGERLFGGLARAGECVADLHLGRGFDVRNDITDVTGEEFFAGKKFLGVQIRKVSDTRLVAPLEVSIMQGEI